MPNKKNNIILVVLFLCSYFFIPFTYAVEDIKGIRGPTISFSTFLTYQFVILLLLSLLYLYYTFVIDKKNIKKTKDDILKEKKKIIIKNLKKLEKNSSDYTKSDFYGELNGYFRDYFSLIGIKDSDTMTLSEIKNMNLNNDLISLYEKSYLNEFNDKRDITKTRIDIIDKLIKIIS